MTTNSNLYPFTSKSTIKARLEADPEYRKQAIVTLFQKQTEWEQAAKATRDRNRVGFMSSHAVHGSKIALKLIAGEALSEEEVSKMDSIVTHYSKQLARFAREDAVRENPALEAVARLFSAT
jgi:hypothetical protein